MIEPILKGLFLGLILSISIGPIIFAIIKQSIQNGYIAGILFVFGVSFSDISFVIIANGFTNFFNSLLAYKKLIALIGSIFLILYGLYSIFIKKIKIDTDDEKNAPKKLNHIYTYFIVGFLMNTLNPAVFIFWFAWTATIASIADNAPHPIQYKTMVFVTCLLFVLFTDLLKVFLANKIKNSLSVSVMNRINKIAGIIIVGFGIFLCWSSFSY